VPVIAVVGNDACWSQIAREQVKLLGDDVGTVLARSDYHRVVEGFGAAGLMVKKTADVPPAAAGPCWSTSGSTGPTSARGSLSMQFAAAPLALALVLAASTE